MPTNRPLPKHEVVGLLADRDADTAPVVTSSYVAEKAGVSRPTALSRLREAEETGDVQSAEAGQATVWWLKEDPITASRARQMFTSGELERNALDAINAGDELRELIEAAREEGEDTDGAVRRLIREGLDRQDADGWVNRIVDAVGIAFISGYPAAAVYVGQPASAATLVVFFAVLVLFRPWINAAIERLPNPVKLFKQRI